MARVLIGGDICPIERNAAMFESGDAEGLFHDLLQDFDRADLVIANLECPLIEQPTPIAKAGPVFGQSTACINGIRAAGIDALCLANNHVFDHGPQGVEATLQTCRRAGVLTVGAGANLDEARQLLVRTVGGVRVGVLAMAEHEFSIATRDTPGANPLDLIDFVRNAAANREVCDYLIVLLHGGAEFLTLPSPRLKETCHFLIEMGAHAVIVQHPHSIGGYERYRERHIVYGQGALVMDEAIYRCMKSFHDGMLVSLSIERGGASSIEFVPLVQSGPLPGARRLDGHGADALFRDLAAKSEAILDDEHLAREWRRFCEREKHEYLSVLLAHSRLLRVANRRGHLARLLYSKRRLLGTRNLVCCETHREVLETVFKAGMI
jgi:poly-gamma-glutamate synthesis protein (capsule biosynthesis protein)